MNSIVIISMMDLTTGNSAGCARILNISKSLALSGNNVYLCSAVNTHEFSLINKKEISNNVYSVGNNSGKEYRNIFTKRIMDIYGAFKLVFKVDNLMDDLDNSAVIYLYPTTKVSLEIFSIIYLKLIKKYKIYYEANEVRRHYLFHKIYSKNWLKRIGERVLTHYTFAKYLIGERLLSKYDGFIVISTTILKFYEKHNKNIIRVPILSNVDDISAECRPSASYDVEKAFKICFTGQIFLKKEGFDSLYAALSIIKVKNINFELHLYGPIEANAKDTLLIDLPTKMGIINNIIYHGVVDQKSIIHEMKKYNLMILPRPLTPQTHYGFSTKLSEYMVSCVPVLVTDVSDNALYIKDGVNGYIVPPGDAKIMAQKIVSIIDSYNRDADKIASNAYLTAKNEFNYSIYSNIISEFMR